MRNDFFGIWKGFRDESNIVDLALVTLVFKTWNKFCCLLFRVWALTYAMVGLYTSRGQPLIKSQTRSRNVALSLVELQSSIKILTKTSLPLPCFFYIVLHLLSEGCIAQLNPEHCQLSGFSVANLQNVENTFRPDSRRHCGLFRRDPESCRTPRTSRGSSRRSFGSQ